MEVQNVYKDTLQITIDHAYYRALCDFFRCLGFLVPKHPASSQAQALTLKKSIPLLFFLTFMETFGIQASFLICSLAIIGNICAFSFLVVVKYRLLYAQPPVHETGMSGTHFFAFATLTLCSLYD